MMCTAKELIAYLQTLPEDTEVMALQDVWGDTHCYSSVDISSCEYDTKGNTLYIWTL